MKVLKFGGSSVAKPERILQIVDILKKYHATNDQFTVVFSAFGGVTDSLISMSQLAAKGDEAYKTPLEEFKARHIAAAEALLAGQHLTGTLPYLHETHKVLESLLYGVFLVREASPRTLDYLLSFGERGAAYIIAQTLDQHGVPSDYLDARQIIVTDKNFGSAQVHFDLTNEKIRAHYAAHKDRTQVVTGFIGAAKGGLTTTLGRGGSDYTAAILAAGLNAQCIEIWTDVDGVMTADPRKVRKAFTMPTMTYAEAMEMSHFGAKVIYPPTLQPALQKNIPLWIKNTFNPDFSGTLVSNQKDPSGPAVKGISSISQVSLLTLSGSGLFGVPGIAGRLFGSLAKNSINVILITQGSSEHSISFAVQPQSANKARKTIENEFEYEMKSKLVDAVMVENDLSVVAAIGENMRYRPGISGRLFQSLGKNGINIVAIAQGSSELNISTVVSSADERKALNAMHEAFFLSDTKVLHVFMVGVGLIGSTLIKQIKAHGKNLKERHSLEIKMVGLSNSRKMLFNEDGIDMGGWEESLRDSETPMNMVDFIEAMKSLNLPNSIFVDNTASDDVATYYETILDKSISISTPNKIATSSEFLHYQRLKKIALQRGVHFLYETNVGAGLPIIGTLNDLINSGDHILKIEGVLSGSLSFIFNSFNEGKRFSDIVKEAQKLGYTEPDPRTDLSGLDVRRKLIILARETGYPLEANDVEIEGFLPDACMMAASVADFFAELEKADAFMEAKRQKAAQQNKMLRMVATLDAGKARIGLQAVDGKHPFHSLDGSDNMIVFTTERYMARPLVIRGPGAGAEVTAAGVFAEIISIGNRIS
jgi:aspartokinase/homoserine dehydrogenase 1